MLRIPDALNLLVLLSHHYGGFIGLCQPKPNRCVCSVKVYGLINVSNGSIHGHYGRGRHDFAEKSQI